MQSRYGSKDHFVFRLAIVVYICCMTILQITPRIAWPLDDGGAIGSYNITRELHELGHTITLFTLNTNKHYQSPSVMESVTDAVYALDINTDISKRGALFNLFSDVPYTFERFYSSEFEQMLSNHLDQHKYDIVFIDATCIAYYYNVVHYHHRGPIVLRAHNVEHFIQNRLAGNEPTLLRRMYRNVLAEKTRLFEERHYPLFDAVYTVTDEDRDRVLDIAPQARPYTVPAGVDTSLFARNITVETTSPSVVFFGSLEWAPNEEAVHWFFKHMYEQLIAAVPDVTIAIGGKNPPKSVIAYQDKPNVEVHANVPSAVDFMSAYDVMFVPLLSGGGMRLKIVEAMSLELPIVSTSVGAEGIKGKHGKDLFVADTADAMLQHLIALLQDKTVRAEMGSNARKLTIQTYSWRAIIESLSDHMSQLVAQHSKNSV